MNLNKANDKKQWIHNNVMIKSAASGEIKTRTGQDQLISSRTGPGGVTPVCGAGSRCRWASVGWSCRWVNPCTHVARELACRGFHKKL